MSESNINKRSFWWFPPKDNYEAQISNKNRRILELKAEVEILRKKLSIIKETLERDDI